MKLGENPPGSHVRVVEGGERAEYESDKDSNQVDASADRFVVAADALGVAASVWPKQTACFYPAYPEL